MFIIKTPKSLQLFFPLKWSWFRAVASGFCSVQNSDVKFVVCKQNRVKPEDWRLLLSWELLRGLKPQKQPEGPKQKPADSRQEASEKHWSSHESLLYSFTYIYIYCVFTVYFIYRVYFMYWVYFIYRVSLNERLTDKMQT